ncbi:MAG: arylesterase, partial [Sulfuricella sp.]|nr:arylesterase [Sulfuricella sp.]
MFMINRLLFVNVRLAKRAPVPLAHLWERARGEGNGHGESVFHDLGRRFALAVCLVFWALAADAAQAILVFGDSLSAAYGIPKDSGWVALLDQRVRQQRPGYRVINASISGETTSGGRYRIERELAEFRPAIVILELGANDGLRGLPLDAARANLDAIIAACRKHDARVLLIGMRLPPNYGAAYATGFQNIYQQAARRYKTPLLPFLL